MEWMDRPGTTLTFTQSPTQKGRKSNLLISVLNWERVGDRTVEEGRAFQQFTHRLTKLFARLFEV